MLGLKKVKEVMRCPIISTCFLYRGALLWASKHKIITLLYLFFSYKIYEFVEEEIELYGLELNGRFSVIFIPLIRDVTVKGKNCFPGENKFCPVRVPSQALE